MTDALDGFLPLDPETARALSAAASRLASAQRELELAAGALVELAGDLKVDAVRRLAERGASDAQIARYEEAFRAAAQALATRRAELAAACADVQAAVDRAR